MCLSIYFYICLYLSASRSSERGVSRGTHLSKTSPNKITIIIIVCTCACASACACACVCVL